MKRSLLIIAVVAGCLGCGRGPAVASPGKELDKPARSAGAPTGEAIAAEKTLGEKEKIEALIKHVANLKDARFVRNDTEYDAASAAEFLRRKWKWKASDISTARDFIEKIATVSSTSGKPYLIRFKDGKEVKSGEYLSSELKKLEKPSDH
jgi:hypothetical protein